MPTTIYILRDPRDNSVRYVGVTGGCPKHRLNQHVCDRSTKTNKGRWAMKLFALNLRPTLEVVGKVCRSDRDTAERKWIAYYRALGAKLVNSTDGGDGFSARHTEESKRKISANRKGIKPHFRDPEARLAAISRALTGRTVSPDVRAKLSALNKGKRKTTEERISEIMRLFDEGLTRREIARRFGMMNSTIGDIVAAEAAKRGQFINPRKFSDRTKARQSAAHRLGRALTPEEHAAF